jgi:hypothetical protein
MKGSDVRKVHFVHATGNTKNLTELRCKMYELCDQFVDGKIPPEQVKQFANLAGKIIGTYKVQVEHAALKSKPDLEGIE